MTKDEATSASVSIPIELITDPEKYKEQVEAGAEKIKQATPEVIEAIREGGLLANVNHLVFDIIPTEGNHGGLIMQIVALFKGDQTYIKSEVLGITDERMQEIATGKEKVTLSEEDGKVYLVLSDTERYEVVMEEYTHAQVAADPSLLEGEDAVFFNGIMNSEAQAARNGFLQLGTDDYLLSYDPTHGLFPDLIEVGLNKFGVPVGVQQQNNEFMLAFNAINPGAFYAGHSAGGVRLYWGLESGERDEFLNVRVQFSGTPVNNSHLYAATNFVTGNYPYVQNNPGDFVGFGLGANAHTFGEWTRSILSAPLLFTDKSPHSNYYCIACNANINSNNK